MPIWLVLAGRNGGLRVTRMTETPPNLRYRGEMWNGALLTVLAQGNRGVRIYGFVVLPLLSPLLPFDGFGIRWWRKGGIWMQQFTTPLLLLGPAPMPQSPLSSGKEQQ